MKNKQKIFYSIGLTVLFVLCGGCRADELLRIVSKKPVNTEGYRLNMNASCGDDCGDWDSCVKSFGCSVAAEVRFEGGSSFFDITPKGGAPAVKRFVFAPSRKGESIRLLVSVSVLGKKTIYDKTIPANYCGGPEIDYELAFHYEGSLIPKMYFRKNEIGCYSDSNEDPDIKQGVIEYGGK